ncbi:BPSS1780 family membrane protein [Chitinibacter sp. GC72]|uniref:BPSS1780 family membrane protein n=1 Tax=Chitinibacter sp. GC72 TaxID=1526917 RepID=UPI0012FA70D0|nr:BPSS1780 family membrane protein [Chitinibacter sp. GC72]
MSEHNPMIDLDAVIDSAIEPRSVATAQGWAWIVQSFRLFRQAPTAWVGMTGLFIVIMLVSSLIPFVGGFLSTLLGPVLLGGLMLAAQRTDLGEQPPIATLFAGFQSYTIDLIKVGAYYMLGTITLMFLLSAAIDGLALIGVIEALPKEISQFSQISHLWPLGLLMLGCFAVVYSAYFYAPALVMLNQMSATDAMKMSFLAFWRNWSPILLMSLLGGLLLLLLMLPFFLGLLIGLPVALISSYVCYADVFSNPAVTGEQA